MYSKWYQKTWVKIVAVIFGVVLISNYFTPSTVAPPESGSAKADAELPSLQMAEIKATRYLKETMKDPDSFEVISAETAFLKAYKSDTSRHKHIQSGIKYRTKNSFGGYVIEQRAVILDNSFTLLEMFEY